MKNIQVEYKKGSRPQINLKVRRVEPSAWKSLNFYKYHYLTAALNPSCKCFVFTWNDEPIAFVGLLNTPRKSVPYGMSISRIVILPDFQGLGLSRIICNWCGGVVKSLSDETHDYRLYIKTAHDTMGKSLSRNPLWKGTMFDMKGRSVESTLSEGKRYKSRLMRVSYCKEYIGDKIDGYQEIMKPIQEMRKNKENKYIELSLNF